MSDPELQEDTDGRNGRLKGTSLSREKRRHGSFAFVVTPPDISNDESNPYLALRQANIARNEARLREIGLLHHTVPKPSAKRSKSSNDSKVHQNSNKRRFRGTDGHDIKYQEHASENMNDGIGSRQMDDLYNLAGEDDLVVVSALPMLTSSSQPLRRSRRIVGRSVNYKEKGNYEYRFKDDLKTRDNDVHITGMSTPTGERVNGEQAWLVADEPEMKHTDARPSKPPAPTTLAPNAARNISLDIPRLVLDHEQGWLGKSMTVTGKSIVMELAAQQFAMENNSFNGKISFNKYCGAQDWKQGIFLWVNLGDPNNTVANDFLEGGRQITWYGGSRMKPTSNMIQKLVRMGKATTGVKDGIVLWCRRYETNKRTFGPYHCLGRLAYHSHNPNVMPVSFVWNLIDYEMLMKIGNKGVREMITSY